jgi:hypothetical protein
MNKKEKAGMAIVIGIVSTFMAALIVGIPVSFMKHEPISFGSFLIGAIMAGSISAYMAIRIPNSPLPHRQDDESGL